MIPETLAAARTLAEDARLAYGGHDAALRSRHQNARLTVVVRGNVRFFAAESGGEQTVSFAGSDDIWDWVGNVSAWKVSRTGIGRIHDGFADCYSRVRRDVEAIVDGASDVTFTGHSLGGALAQVAAAQAARRGCAVTRVHTFGAPMVGDSDWAEFYDSCGIDTHCWVVGWDRVPLQPSFLGFRLGYRAVSGRHYVGLDGRLLTKPPRILSGKPWRTWTRRRTNHSMFTYCEALGRVRVPDPENSAHE